MAIGSNSHTAATKSFFHTNQLSFRSVHAVQKSTSTTEHCGHSTQNNQRKTCAELTRWQKRKTTLMKNRSPSVSHLKEKFSVIVRMKNIIVSGSRHMLQNCLHASPHSLKSVSLCLMLFALYITSGMAHGADVKTVTNTDATGKASSTAVMWKLLRTTKESKSGSSGFKAFENTISSLMPPARIQKRSIGGRKQTGLRFNSHRSPQRIVTKVGGFYIEIRKNGKVKGTRKQNDYSVFEFTSVQSGVVVIRAKKSGRFLAMDRKGRLVGMKTYSKACNFREGLVENNYFIFYQNVDVQAGRKVFRKQVYMGFDRRGRPKRGRKVQKNDSSTHFQILAAQYPSRGR